MVNSSSPRAEAMLGAKPDCIQQKYYFRCQSQIEMEQKYLQADRVLAKGCGCSRHFHVSINKAHLHAVIDHKALILLLGNTKIKYPEQRDRAEDSKPSKSSIFVCNSSR